MDFELRQVIFVLGKEFVGHLANLGQRQHGGGQPGRNPGRDPALILGSHPERLMLPMTSVLTGALIKPII